MRYLVLASDYDGTLASDGRVNDVTLKALESIRATGRKLILVSGRFLVDLQRVFPRIDLFDMVVVENGAVLYRPADGSMTLASGKIPRHFIDELGLPPEKRHENELESATGRRRTNEGEPVQRRTDHRDIAGA